MKRTLSVLFSVFLLLTLFAEIVSAAPYQKEGALRSEQIAVYNTETEMTVFQKNATERVFPGATAKIITGIVALEYFAGDMDREITVSPFALQGLYGTAVLDLETGEKIKAKDLIYATLVAGMNDAASVLALEIGGDFPTFAKMMNEKAEEIGALDTVYYNPTGLDHPMAHTTAADTAKIAAYAYKNKLFIQMSNTRAYTVPPTNLHDAVTIYTRNSLLTPQNASYFKDAEGMCVGYTELSGFSVVTATTSGTFPYICVTFGAEKADDAYRDTKNLLLWAENNFRERKVLDISKIVAELPVKGGTANHVLIVPEKTVYAVLDKDIAEDAISYSVNLREETLQAPVEKGTDVGEILILVNGDPVNGIPLVTKTEITEKSGSAFRHILKNPFFIVTTVILLFLFAIFLYGKYYQNYKKHSPDKRS